MPLIVRLVFYYDVVCPFAYLASTHVEALAARTGADLVWTPILLGGVFRAIGAPDLPAATLPAAKVAHNFRDMQRWAAHLGVALRLPAEHPRRTVEAMRLCHLVDGADRVRLTRALYRAYFVEGRDVADRQALAAICGEQGLDPQLASARIADPQPKERLRIATDEAVSDGVFGVPAFVVVDGDRRTLFWGQDRMCLVERSLGGWAPRGPQ